jgi:hypothetical protein
MTAAMPERRPATEQISGVIERVNDLRCEMRFRQIKWGPVLLCGWLVILGTAAVILPRTVSNAVALSML